MKAKKTRKCLHPRGNYILIARVDNHSFNSQLSRHGLGYSVAQAYRSFTKAAHEGIPDGEATDD